MVLERRLRIILRGPGAADMELSHMTISFGEAVTMLVIVVGLLTHYFTTNNRITRVETQYEDFKEFVKTSQKTWEANVKRDIDFLFNMIRECKREKIFDNDKGC